VKWIKNAQSIRRNATDITSKRTEEKDRLKTETVMTRVATGHWRCVGDSVSNGDRCDVCRGWTDKATSWQRSYYCSLLRSTNTDSHAG